MRLLVSVTCAAEASAALAGGADLIDAKDPQAGALGAVSAEVLREIYAAVAGQRPVTAALGDAGDEAAIERAATLTTAAVRGASAVSDGNGGVVAVAYADADRAASLAPTDLVKIAARAGARGLLLDTADKVGPGLRGLIAPGEIAAWVAEAHDAGLFV